MVESWTAPALDEARIVLRPNRAWTWRANLGLFYTLCAVSITIAFSFLLRGMWMILPFSLLELGLLYLCLRYLLRRTAEQEVIIFTDAQVRIECGRNTPERVTHFDRYRTQVQVTPGKRAVRQRIAFRSREQEQVVGSFLNDADQQALIKELRRIVGLFATPAHRRLALYASATGAGSVPP